MESGIGVVSPVRSRNISNILSKLPRVLSHLRVGIDQLGLPRLKVILTLKAPIKLPWESCMMRSFLGNGFGKWIFFQELKLLSGSVTIIA